MVAGEASGDNLGSSIIKEWKKKETLEVFGTGGNKMEKEGINLLYTIHDLEVIGFSAIIKKYHFLKKVLTHLTKKAEDSKTDIAVLIDYPGFNMRLATLLKKKEIKVIQVVSPQIWAWNYRRIYRIKENIHHVLCLYPFETEIYKKEDIPASYIGHPLAEEIQTFIKKKKESKKNQKHNTKKISDKKTIALLPGSRTKEITSLLPEMLETAYKYYQEYPNTRFLLTSPNPIINNMEIPNFITRTQKNSHEVIYQSDAAIACSGTVTLELALFSVPYFLIYKTSSVNYHIFKRLIKIPYIGIANVIAGKFIIKEYLQKEVDPQKMTEELKRITLDKSAILEMKNSFRKLKKEMGYGSAARKAVQILTKEIKQNEK